jgi:hypothetical protein
LKSYFVIKIDYKSIFDDKPTIPSLLKEIDIKESLVTLSLINKHQSRIQKTPEDEIRFIVNEWLVDCDKNIKEQIVRSFIKHSVKTPDQKLKNVVVFNRVSILRLMEIISSQNKKDKTQHNPLSLFKLFLLVNDEVSIRQEKVFQNSFSKNLNRNNDTLFNLFIGLTQPFQKHGRAVHVFPELLKSLIFDKWLRKRPDYLEMSENYLKELGLSNWGDYFNDVFILSGVSTENPIIQITTYPHLRPLLESLESYKDYDLKWSEFKNIKKRPVVKLDENTYVVLDFELLLNKFFTSVYHDLLEYSKNYYPNFSQDFNSEFLEQDLLNQSLKVVFENKYVQFSEVEMKSRGKKNIENISLPDYYIRNGRKTIMIECKNSFISNNNKIDLDFEKLVKEINDKFYYVENKKNSKRKSKAILQLLDFIKNSINGVYSFFDNVKNPDRLVFYPIILTTDLTLTFMGFNKYLNSLFKKEIQSSEDLHSVRIKNLTIIHIDDFFIHQKRLKHLTTLIDQYHNYLKNKEGFVSMISFSDYLNYEVFNEINNYNIKDIEHIIKDSILSENERQSKDF